MKLSGKIFQVIYQYIYIYIYIYIRGTFNKFPDILYTQEDFQGAFKKWLERCNKCIAAGGNYFEGD